MPSHRAVILAGGKGIRLRPFTASFPKPLVPLGDRPILEIIIQQLSDQKFGHLSHLIRSFVESHHSIPRKVDVDFVFDRNVTGTAGSLASIPDLNETFLVINGDVLTNIDYNELVRSHKRAGAALTIATHLKKVKVELGILQVDETGGLRGYVEKPEQHFEMSMGIYVYEPHVLRYIEPNTYLDVPTLVQKLLDDGQKVHVHRNTAFWLDIGRPDDYAKEQEIVNEQPGLFFGKRENISPLQMPAELSSMANGSYSAA